MEQTELVIMICSLRDSRLAKAVSKYMMTFHMAKDLNLELKTHDECEELLALGKLPKKQSYWWPDEDGYALVIESRAKNYRQTWEQMTTCYSDFCAGWAAAHKTD